MTPIHHHFITIIMITMINSNLIFIQHIFIKNIFFFSLIVYKNIVMMWCWLLILAVCLTTMPLLLAYYTAVVTSHRNLYSHIYILLINITSSIFLYHYYATWNMAMGLWPCFYHM